MLNHGERPASALAHGPAKPADIERVRRDVKAAEARGPRVRRAIEEVAPAFETNRGDLHTRKRTVAGGQTGARTRAEVATRATTANRVAAPERAPHRDRAEALTIDAQDGAASDDRAWAERLHRMADGLA